MSRPAIALAAALALAPVSSPAMAASPAFDAFRHICVDSGADKARALAAAADNAFVHPPESLANRLSGIHFDEQEVRGKMVDGAVYLVVLGHRPFPSGPTPNATMNLCFLAAFPATDGAAREVEAFAGAGLLPSQAQPTYLFTGDPAHRRAAATQSEADLLAAVGRHDFQLAGIDTGPEGDVLMYGVVAP